MDFFVFLLFNFFFQLVDLKYITNTQIIELNYESNRRRFTVHSILPRGFVHKKNTEIEDKLSHDINALALDQPKQLWSVTWDCVVSIISDDHTERERAPAPDKVGKPSIFLLVTQLMSLFRPWSATNRDVGTTFYQGCLLIGRGPQ